MSNDVSLSHLAKPHSSSLESRRFEWNVAKNIVSYLEVQPEGREDALPHQRPLPVLRVTAGLLTGLGGQQQAYEQSCQHMIYQQQNA